MRKFKIGDEIYIHPDYWSRYSIPTKNVKFKIIDYKPDGWNDEYGNWYEIRPSINVCDFYILHKEVYESPLYQLLREDN